MAPETCGDEGYGILTYVHPNAHLNAFTQVGDKNLGHGGYLNHLQLIFCDLLSCAL